VQLDVGSTRRMDDSFLQLLFFYTKYLHGELNRNTETCRNVENCVSTVYECGLFHIYTWCVRLLLNCEIKGMKEDRGKPTPQSHLDS